MHDEGSEVHLRTRTHSVRRHGGTRLTGRLWFGVVLLCLGLLWTLDNLRYVDAGEILEWWPLALVAFGAVKLIGVGGRSQPIAGTVWLVAGGLLLAHNQRVLPWGLHELWPLGLVVLGAWLVWRSVRGPQAGQQGAGGATGMFIEVVAGVDAGGKDAASETSGPSASDTFSGFAMWSGVDRKPTSQAFRGGDFTAIMGGGEVDLRGAKPVPGGCVIEVFLLMGGLDIYVPPGWTVVNELFAVMGGIEDSRKSVPPDGADVLILKGIAVMGGVEIQN
jgi:hypothetical protein